MKPQFILAALVIPFCMNSFALADGGIPADSMSPADYSAAGAISVAAGVLQTIATPIKFTGELMDSQNPATVSDKAANNLSEGLSATGTGIVLLTEGTGKGLSELTTDTIQAGSVLVGTTVEAVKASIPTVTITFNNDKQQSVKKSIPLVVRKQYVEMNEKLEDQPCQ